MKQSYGPDDLAMFQLQNINNLVNGIVESVNRKKYCLVVTDDCSKFSWVFFLAYKDETYDMLHDLIVGLENKLRHKVKTIRSPIHQFFHETFDVLTILNTLDHLGKFDGKSEEGYLLGYSTNSKGFRVYNRVTRKVQDCLHVNFLENQENQKGKGPDWMFDLELLTPSMNYIPVRKENYADSKEQGISCDDDEDLDVQQFIVHGPNIHAAQNKPSEERTADKEVPLSSEEQALHDDLLLNFIMMLKGTLLKKKRRELHLQREKNVPIVLSL
ncbi:hypothetical protein Tco_0615024 [Tanacetum coccineum]